MWHVLRRHTLIRGTLEEVFPFFAAAENLEAITPPWLSFGILTPTPIEMRRGTLIQYRLQLMGVPMRWLTRISAWEPPHRFIDEQLEGPYRDWIHEHRFEPLGGYTLMTDTVRYRLPLSPLGELAFPLVRLQLKQIFDYRSVKILELVEGKLLL